MTVLFVILMCVAIWCGTKMAMTDAKIRIIPDIYLFPFLLIGLFNSGFIPMWITDINDAIIAGIFGYGIGIIFDGIYRLRGREDAIGFGDVKLMMAGGIWLGPIGLAITLMISCFAGLIWGMRKKEKFIPFAPFFFAGMIVSWIIMFFVV